MINLEQSLMDSYHHLPSRESDSKLILFYFFISSSKKTLSFLLVSSSYEIVKKDPITSVFSLDLRHTDFGPKFIATECIFL